MSVLDAGVWRLGLHAASRLNYANYPYSMELNYDALSF
jgi:hypothetical protein